MSRNIGIVNCNRMQVIALTAIAICCGALLPQIAAAALINIANLAPVIGGSGSAFNENYDAVDPTQFSFMEATRNVTDGAGAAGGDNNTGAIAAENFNDGSYWGGKDGTTGYFVLDLGMSYPIAKIDLFNSNQGRGTGDFTIKASNSVTLVSAALGDDLSGTIVTLASGRLTVDTTVDQPFISSDTSNYYRYIRFDAVNRFYTSVPSDTINQGVGLNEIRVFAAPEPASLSMLAAGGLLILRRRRGNARV